MIKVFKIALIATVLVYMSGLAFTYYTNEKFSQQFEQFDLDQNGVLNGDESTKESQVFLNQMAARKTTEQAFIVLIPVSLIIGLFVFGIGYLFRKIKYINDNEVQYRSNN